MNRTEIRKKRWIAATDIVGLLTLLLLVNFVDALGIAYFAAAFQIYLLLQVLTAGLPDLVTRMVRARIAKEQYKNADKVLKSVRIYGVLAGACGALTLLCGSGVIADGMIKIPEMSLTLKILAPVFFLDAVSAVLQGYFQAVGTTVPTVICRFLKQVGCLAFSILFSHIQLGYGKKVAALLHNDKFSNMYGASGIAIGLLIATALSAAFLLLIYLGAGRRKRRFSREGMRLTENAIEVFIQFVKRLLPEAAPGFLLYLGLLFGLILYRAKSGDSAVVFGAYGSYFAGFFILNAIVISLFVIVMMGAENSILSSVKKEEYKTAKNYFSGGLQFLFVCGAFLSAMGLALSDGIASALFRNAGTAYEAAACIRIGFLCPLLFPAGLYFAHILANAGRQKLLLLSALSALAAYIVAVSVIMTGEKGSVHALVWGAVISGAVYCGMNGFFAVKEMSCNPHWLRILAMPAAAAAVIGVSIFLLQKALISVAGAAVVVVIGLVVGIFCYMVLLLLFRCIGEEDLQYMPGSALLNVFGRMLHFW